MERSRCSSSPNTRRVWAGSGGIRSERDPPIKERSELAAVGDVFDFREQMLDFRWRRELRLDRRRVLAAKQNATCPDKKNSLGKPMMRQKGLTEADPRLPDLRFFEEYAARTRTVMYLTMVGPQQRQPSMTSGNPHGRLSGAIALRKVSR